MEEDELIDEQQIETESEQEYEHLLALFEELLDRFDNMTIELEELEELVEARALFAFGHCVRRFGLTLEEALAVVKNRDKTKLTPAERRRSELLTAALDNLIDFATAEETQMYMELEEQDEEEDPEEVFELYNKHYATTENKDIDYAALVALWWADISDQTTLMYMTQGDERVRDSHRALEGLSFRKADFPEWLIPPIDWRCRCYLVESNERPTHNSAADVDKELASAVNPVFKSSLATGGPIFSEEHPYFLVNEELVKPMQTIAEHIRTKYNLT